MKNNKNSEKKNVRNNNTKNIPAVQNTKEGNARKKPKLSVILALVAVVLLSAAFIFFVLGPFDERGLAYEVNEDGTTCTITGIGSCKSKIIEIPEYMDVFSESDRKSMQCCALSRKSFKHNLLSL